MLILKSKFANILINSLTQKTVFQGDYKLFKKTQLSLKFTFIFVFNFFLHTITIRRYIRIIKTSLFIN